MSESTVPAKRLENTRMRRSRRGQTLVVALAVLFILLFVGGFFVTRIARNLVAAGRSRDTQDAQTLAEAGLNYCNDHLDSSVEGADWRPGPSTPVNNADPDYYWLERGFSRLSLPGGRALVRVAYDPNPYNPAGQALRIEAVGRIGELPTNGSDPTVFVPNGTSPRLRRELIAYKRIGLTDYGFFITGKTRASMPNYIGTPAIGHNVPTVLGNPMLGYAQFQAGLAVDAAGNTQVLYGFPIYVNGGLTFGSDTYLYESPRGTSGAVVGDPAALQQDTVYVNGQITLEPSRTQRDYPNLDDTVYPAYINTEIDQDPVPANAIHSSSDPQFTTFGGIVRDGNGLGTLQKDTAGYTRSVSRLDPPLMDANAYGTGIMRYRALTRDSGYWYRENGRQVNTGQFGLGTGVYVDNFSDLQTETQAVGLNGFYSQRSDWLNPGSSANWQGPIYAPPALNVHLAGNHIILTRSATDPKTFDNPNLTPNGQNGGKTLDIDLSDYVRKSTYLDSPTDSIALQPFPHDGDDPSNPNTPFGDKHSYGVSVVIYAEGNVDVRGVYGAITNVNDTTESSTVSKLGRVHLTIVCGGTAYIDGNVIKGDGYSDGGGIHMERASTCAILAKDYVCVNTTQFLKPANNFSVWGDTSGTGIPALEIGQSAQNYDALFAWGVDPTTYKTNGNPSPVFLMVRQAALGNVASPALINIGFNPALSPAPSAGDPIPWLYQFPFNYATLPGGPDYYAYGVASPGTTLQAEALGFAINPAGTFLKDTLYPLTELPGYENTVRFQLDQTVAGQGGPSGTSDYLLSSAAVVPADIRIEACLYAQEKSFFVIPGYSFNPDATDTRAAYQAGRVRVSYDTNETQDADLDPNDPKVPSRIAKDVYPFYNEPADVRITIFGSVAMNYTATAGDQAAWMSRWGYIPEYYGSTYSYDAANRIVTPDDHLMVHDPAIGSDIVAYTPGQDATLDYRTPLEKQTGNLPASAQDIPITSGMRYVYDPAFAMPYYKPTDVNLGGTDTGSAGLRKQRALRSTMTVITVPNGQTYTIEQVLPPIPRLPVCPNMLYSGDSDQLIGADPTDTDKL